MQTMARLTSAYHSARVEEFDANSRYVILSPDPPSLVGCVSVA